MARILIAGGALAVVVGCGSDAGQGPAAPETLEIRQLSPTSIGARTAGFNIQVWGSGFTSESRVMLGDTELTTIGHTPTTLIAHVGGGTAGTTVPGPLAVSVRNSDGSRSNQLLLTVAAAPAPVLTRVDSNMCLHGPLRVEILGENFTTDMRLESNGQAVSIVTQSSTTLSFSVPRISGFYSFKVTVSPPGGGEASIGYGTFLGCD